VNVDFRIRKLEIENAVVRKCKEEVLKELSIVPGVGSI
jgi:hypothetical protein